MTATLIEYNRDMNRVFGACIAIQNTARSLDATMLEMELLARNGVAKAARLAAGHGRPLLVLAEILAGLPADMRVQVAALDDRCQDLTRRTADASNRVRLYYQFVRSVAAMEAGETADPAPIRARADAARGSIESHLEDAASIVKSLDTELVELHTIGRTARYLAQHIEIEASQIRESRDAFVSLARNIHAAIDHLESVLVELRSAVRDGDDKLRSLRDRLETT